MYQNKKFERAAKKRNHLALAVAVLLHLAVFAAISSDVNFKELVPDFVKEIFGNQPVVKQDVPVP